MSKRINRLLFEEEYSEVINCIIDDMNDMTMYNSEKIRNRKEYMINLLKEVHKENLKLMMKKNAKRG